VAQRTEKSCPCQNRIHTSWSEGETRSRSRTISKESTGTMHKEEVQSYSIAGTISMFILSDKCDCRSTCKIVTQASGVLPQSRSHNFHSGLVTLANHPLSFRPGVVPGPLLVAHVLERRRVALLRLALACSPFLFGAHAASSTRTVIYKSRHSVVEYAVQSLATPSWMRATFPPLHLAFHVLTLITIHSRLSDLYSPLLSTVINSQD
jgi:hypothetical protein